MWYYISIIYFTCNFRYGPGRGGGRGGPGGSGGRGGPMRGGPPYGGRNMGGGQGNVSDRYFGKVIQYICVIFK